MELIKEDDVNDHEIQLINMRDQLSMNKSLLKRMHKVYEAERKEWEQLLHDDFGQSLAAIKSFATLIKDTSGQDSDVYDLAGIIQATTSELYISVYDLMRSLRSGFINELDLQSSIQVCINNSRLSQKSIQTELYADGELESLGKFLNVIVLRIIQENLIGIVRSFEPNKIIIKVSRTQSDLSNGIQINEDKKQMAREVLNINMLSAGRHTIECNQPIQKFSRIYNYVDALGGEYDIKVEGSHIEIQVKLDMDDLIMEDNE